MAGNVPRAVRTPLGRLARRSAAVLASLTRGAPRSPVRCPQ